MNIKKTRKPRRIKNGLMDLDDVTMEPRDNFINWKTEIRRKLKDREHTLLQKRVEICCHLIASAIHQFKVQSMPYFINRDIVGQQDICHISSFCERTEKEMMKELRNWHGIKQKTIDKIRRDRITFRTYWEKSRNWWDQKKMHILALQFWIPIINRIQMLSREAARKFFCRRFINLQRLYSSYLNLLILQYLFEGTVNTRPNAPNARPMQLIAVNVYIKLMQEKDVGFMTHLSQLNGLNAKSSGNEIRSIIVKAVKYECEMNKKQFEENLLSLHEKIHISPPTIPSIIPISNCINYCPQYSQSYNVSRIRYHPY